MTAQETTHISPSPVYKLQPIHIDNIQANFYNPNFVAPPEFELLQVSILKDGYTMPIVCWKLPNGKYEIIDGFHRFKAMQLNKTIRKRENGFLPVTVLEGKDDSERIASTIRHNRARGVHNVEKMRDIIIGIIENSGRTDQWIMKHIGADREELFRYKQMGGLQSVFRNAEYTPLDDEGLKDLAVLRSDMRK